MRKLGHVLAVFVVALALSAWVVGTAAASHSPSASSTCVDHADNGKGNLGDPGNGGNHHNEDKGKGNHADPGNGNGHYCPNE